MTDYTPTTEEVRNRYLDVLPPNMFYSEEDAEQYEAEPNAEFDRWLAEVKAQERKAERERTIKLLEDTPATRTTWIDDGISVYALDKDDFIALIKGEEQ